jgi:hypothetical protein
MARHQFGSEVGPDSPRIPDTLIMSVADIGALR